MSDFANNKSILSFQGFEVCFSCMNDCCDDVAKNDAMSDSCDSSVLFIRITVLEFVVDAIPGGCGCGCSRNHGLNAGDVIALRT